MLITSLQNQRVKQVIALRERRERKRTGLMLVEGYEELSLANASGVPLQTLFYCRDLFPAGQQRRLLDQLRHIEQIEVSDKVFEKIAYRENPDGWLALCPAPRLTPAELTLKPDPLLVVAERVEKPGNLGAILRTADAAGVDAVISCDPGTDWGNPNVVRSSKGALFSVPVAEGDATATLSWLKAQQIQIVAATPQAEQLYTQVDLRGAIAIAVGTEKHGLTDQWLAQADIAVKIPMFGQVNSLNVATATALLIYEAVRQRTPP